MYLHKSTMAANRFIEAAYTETCLQWFLYFSIGKVHLTQHLSVFDSGFYNNELQLYLNLLKTRQSDV